MALRTCGERSASFFSRCCRRGMAACRCCTISISSQVCGQQVTQLDQDFLQLGHARRLPVRFRLARAQVAQGFRRSGERSAGRSAAGCRSTRQKNTPSAILEHEVAALQLLAVLSRPGWEAAPCRAVRASADASQCRRTARSAMPARSPAHPATTDCCPAPTPMWLGTMSSTRPMPARFQLAHELLELLFRPDLRVQLVVVGDVVAVHAAGRDFRMGEE